MKTIYLIRHGESEDNVSHVESRDHTPLSESGKKQAEKLAERFSSVPVDAILSSPFTRAHDTADAVAKAKGIEIEFSELFVERRVPSSIYGKSFESQELRNVYDDLNKNYSIPGARHSDEETFEELKERARKAVAYLEESSAESILVATHGMFIIMLISYMIFGEKVTGEEFIRMFRALKTSNTGISVCNFDSKVRNEKYTGWKVLAWNDHAHLD